MANFLSVLGQMGSNLRDWYKVATQPKLRQDFVSYVAKPTVAKIKQRVSTPYRDVVAQNTQQARKQSWYQSPVMQQARMATLPPPTQGIPYTPLVSPLKSFKRLWQKPEVKMFSFEDEAMPDIRKKLAMAEVLSPEEKKKAFREQMFAVADIALTPAKMAKKAFSFDSKWLETTEEGIKKLKTKIPALQTTRPSLQKAEVLSASLKEKGPMNAIKNAWRTWVNSRQATNIETLAKKTEFANLDSLGERGIHEFQAGIKKNEFKELRNYFNSKYAQIKKSGLPIEYREDYLPQLWANTAEEVRGVFGRRMGLKPSFTFDRVLENYMEGIEKGLTPKFNKLSDLAGWYEGRANKALADKKFWDFLIKDSIIAPSHKAPPGWKTLDADRFPRFTGKVAEGKYVGTYSAPEELAEMVNGYLRQPEGVLNAIANYASSIKNIVLSSGIPTTAINFHGVNVIFRHTLASSNPVKGLIEGLAYLAKPSLARKTLMKNLPEAVFASKHGLKLSTEGHVMELAQQSSRKGILKKAFGKLTDIHQELFEKPLFQDVLPAIKISQFNQVYDDLIKHGMKTKKAGRQAADVINSIYGGINWEQFGRSRTTQAWLRSSILAPDWAETQFRTAGGIVKGVMKPGSPELKTYRMILRNLFFAYASANVINKISSGHWMWDNEPGHTFEVDAGETADEKKRYIRFMGTAGDFIRIPHDVALSLVKGDTSSIFRVIRNRLSIPAGIVIGLLANVDYRGQPIHGKTKYGTPMTSLQSFGGLMSELSRGVAPPYVKAGIDIATGRIGPEQFVSQAIEAPTRYTSGMADIYEAQTKSKGASAKRKRAAEKLDKQFLKLSPAEAGRKYAELKNTDPLLYEALTNVIDARKLDLTKRESLIKNLTVRDGTRAKTIMDEIEKLPLEERAAKFDEWSEKKIITKTVAEQITEALKSQPAETKKRTFKFPKLIRTAQAAEKGSLTGQKRVRDLNIALKLKKEQPDWYAMNIGPAGEKKLWGYELSPEGQEAIEKEQGTGGTWVPDVTDKGGNSYNKFIEDIFGDNAGSAKQILAWEDDSGKKGGENQGFEAGKEKDFTNKNGSVDRGLFRINSVHFTEPEMKRREKKLKAAGITSWEDMLDPEKNIKMAKIIFEEQGWSAWVAAPEWLKNK